MSPKPAGVPSSAYRVQVVNADGKWTDVIPGGPIVGFVRAVEVFDAVVPTFEKRILRGMGQARWKILNEADVNRLCGRKIVAPKETP